MIYFYIAVEVHASICHMSTSDVVYFASLQFRGKVTKNVYENDAVFSYLSHYLYNISKGYTSSEHMTNIELTEFPLSICDVSGNLTIFKSYNKTIIITWRYMMLCAYHLPHFKASKLLLPNDIVGPKK